MTKKKTEKKTNPADKLGDIVDAGASIVGTYLDSRYKIEKRVGEFRDEAEAKVEEIKDEAIQSAYEMKKGLVRAVIELVLLSTGVFALVLGGVLVLRRYLPLENILLAYGLVVTLVTLLKMKTS